MTLKTNTVADSTLTVANRCKNSHQFQIQLQNVPFLQLSQNQANVKGGQTQVITGEVRHEKLGARRLPRNSRGDVSELFD